MNWDWRSLSYAYIFAILANGRWIDGAAQSLHPESQGAYNFILGHLQQYRLYPTVDHLKERFNLDWRHHYKQNISIEEISDRLKREKARYDTQATITEMQKLLTIDNDSLSPGLLARPLLELQSKLFTISENKTFRLSEWRESYTYFATGQDAVRICNYGFPTIDQITGGISANQLIILYANTTQGKSTLARAIAANIAMQGKTVLYYTLEESGRKSVIKSLSTLVRVNATSIIDNTISADAYKKLCEFGNVPGDVIFIDRVEHKSVGELHRHAQQYKPDVVILDQIPLFTKDGSMRVDDVTQVSRNLKEFAQQSHIPTIALTQATRIGIKSKKPTMEDTMGFAYAMCQDGDVVIFLWPDEQGPQWIRKRLTFLKNRDREKNQNLDLRWDLRHGIIEEESLSTVTPMQIQPGGFYAPAQPAAIQIPQFTNFAQAI